MITAKIMLIKIMELVQSLSLSSKPFVIPNLVMLLASILIEISLMVSQEVLGVYAP